MNRGIFEGKGCELELARELTQEGVVVSTPLVKVGVDLLASDSEFKRTIPIQVIYKSQESNLFFSKNEFTTYLNIDDLYVAYFLNNSQWYIPFEIIKTHITDNKRDDGAVYIKLKGGIEAEEKN